jgi:hypothetical protein
MPPRIDITPEAAAAARELYERTLTPVSEICARMGVSRSVLYARAKEWNWQGRRYSAGDEGLHDVSENVAEARSAEAAATGASTDERRAALYLRALRAAEVEMTVIEHSLRVLDPKTEAQSERAARTTATLNRSLREIIAIATPDAAHADDSAQDQIPRDLDALRDELARRINAFVDARRADGDAGDCRGDGRLERAGD